MSWPSGDLIVSRSVSHLLRALETFSALGIAFVSLSEQMDRTTPTGKMVFTVLGAVAELERSLIAERVRAGLRNARAKGKTSGRPRVTVDAARIGRLRAQGRSIREIADELGYSRGVVHKTLGNRGPAVLQLQPTSTAHFASHKELIDGHETPRIPQPRGSSAILVG